MIIVPVNDRVLLRPDPIVEEEMRGGLIVARQATPTTRMATVMAVGEGMVRGDIHMEIPLTAGERVYISAYAGTELEIDDEKLLLVPYGDILARVEDA